MKWIPRNLSDLHHQSYVALRPEQAHDSQIEVFRDIRGKILLSWLTKYFLMKDEWRTAAHFFLQGGTACVFFYGLVASYLF
jgi:hypothetical protein